ncbi:MAG: AI-2E family transporter [Bdellovibrionales bacterium]|nr:AI-2E family transporter [Bdellovibrionales bacterium]
MQRAPHRQSHSFSQRDSLLPPLWVLSLLLVFFGGWLVYQLKEIVTLLVVGYSAAYVVSPALDAFERRGVRRSLGFFALFAVFALVLALLFMTAIPTLVREYSSFAENLPAYIEKAKLRLGPFWELVREALPWKSLREDEHLDLLQHLPPINGELMQSVAKGVGQTLLRGYNLTLTVVNLFLLPFIVYYVAIDFHHIHRAALEWLPMLSRAKVENMALEINRYVSAYVRGQLTVGCLLFVLYSLGLGILGVELWLLVAFVAGFGNLIPYLGSIVGILLGSLMALVTFGDWSHLFMTWGVFAVVQFLEGTFITPTVVGDKVGLSPLAVILAIVAGGSLFGLLGIFLAVPVVAIVRVLARNFHSWLIWKAQAR